MVRIGAMGLVRFLPRQSEIQHSAQHRIFRRKKKTDGFKNDTRFSVPFSFIFKRLGLWNMDPPNKCGQQMKQSWAARPSSSHSHFNIKFKKTKQKTCAEKFVYRKPRAALDWRMAIGLNGFIAFAGAV